MNFEHLTPSSITEKKCHSFYSPYHSQVYPALEKKSVERYKIKAIEFPGLTVITIFSQIFLSDKQKRFSSNKNWF